MTTTGTASFVPNSYPTPNAFTDKLLHLMGPTEWKVLSFAIRHILGWQDKLAERKAVISLTMFTDGYITKGGDRYFGTGLSRQIA